jgi:hypothetical protein
MTATLITVSPRVHVEDLERMVRSRVARDGVAALVAPSGDPRQRRQLDRLVERLANDAQLDCYLADHPDGTALLSVFRRAERDRRR